MIYLITGGTGSLGQAITKELIKIGCFVRIFSRGEHAQWAMKQEYPSIDYMIGDVRDKDRLLEAMQGIEAVIHCAALKHVPVCQADASEAIKTNILGSMNVIDCAIKAGVKKVLAVSSDKAVYPVNMYGATKLVEEQLFINRDVIGTRFACLRPGNYFESSGNVFELWDEQAKTGTCTLTDQKMYRYFIHIEDAAKFAIKCLRNMYGGEVFIPKMKEYSMIELLKERHPEAQVRLIGKRPGERLHEPLFTDEERPEDYGDYYVIKQKILGQPTN